MPTKKPEWLKIRPPSTEKFIKVKRILRKYDLHTVCEEAHCPNISKCWSCGTDTFMILGNICTRYCKFCNVKTGNPHKEIDEGEPQRLANAIKELNLNYIVLTSVDRDDLEDGGALHFAKCIKKIKENTKVVVEVLIPDFSLSLLKKVVDATPNVVGHNLETVERLQEEVRDVRASYKKSLKVLENVKELNSKIYTKSSLMLGLGESKKEVLQAMQDLRNVDVDILTLGQYLRPSSKQLEVKEYIHPLKFDFFRKKAEEMGFLYAASGPFVRSSYNSAELFLKNIVNN